MKNMAAFRVTALSCFYFALLSLVSPFRNSLLATAVTAVLILAASLAAVHFQKPAVRLAFFILPLVWIVMIAMVDWPQLALTAAGCALPVLAALIHSEPLYDGTVNGLLASLDRWGVDRAVITVVGAVEGGDSGSGEEPSSGSDICKLCGKDHGTTIWGRLVAFIHMIIYFFKTLFR